MSNQTQKASKVVPLPTLSARGGEHSGTVFRLREEAGTIGRREDNAYVVSDPRISRVHASVRKEGGAYILTDLGSSGGTKINGETANGPSVLHHGDVVSLGPVEFVFEDPSSMVQSDDETMVLEVPEVHSGPSLSPRQQQVIELMAEGMTNREIGEQLGVTERTVKAYAQELYDKLGARNRAEAVAEAVKAGLI